MSVTKNTSAFIELFAVQDSVSEAKNASSHVSSSSTSHIIGEEIEHTNERHGQSEVSLLRAVILQAIIDRMNNSKRTEDKIAKTDALNWFNSQNHDFRLICDLAGWSPEWVIEITEGAIRNPEKWRRNHGRYN